jgi:hypothetical protein
MHAETIFHMRLNYFLIGEAFLFAALFTATANQNIRSIVRLLPILGTFVTYSYWFAIVRAEDKLAFFQDVLDSICGLYYFHRRRAGKTAPDSSVQPKSASVHVRFMDFFLAWLNKSYLFIAWFAPAVALWAWIVVLMLLVPERAFFWNSVMIVFVLVFAGLVMLPARLLPGSRFPNR